MDGDAVMHWTVELSWIVSNKMMMRVEIGLLNWRLSNPSSGRYLTRWACKIRVEVSTGQFEETDT